MEVEVRRKEVLSQEALLEEWKEEVTEVWVEAMMVESKAPI